MAQINFQPEDAVIPNGYLEDFGLGYDAGRGYGWVTLESLDNATPTPVDLSGTTRDRNTESDQRLDTLIHLQLNQPGAWEYELDNGSYEVTVGVGDPLYFDSSHTINVEGVEAISDFQPSSSQKFATATTTVEVDDGKLTVDAMGGNNTKLNYIEFEPVTTSDDLVAQINFQPSGSVIPNGYLGDFGLGYSASRGYGWVTPASLNNSTPTPVNLSGATRDRDTESDRRLDTLIHLQLNQPGAWEYALEDGSYEVTVSVGDPLYFNSSHTINVEGVEAISSFQPSSSQKFATATTTVQVDDGKLTVDAMGGNNTKLNYIEIVKAEDVTPPPPPTEDKVNDPNGQFNFQPSGVPVPDGYSTDFGNAYDPTVGYGWVTQESVGDSTQTPLDITGLARDRNAVSAQRVDTLLHMQLNEEGAWQYNIPNGRYSVTASVGDPSYFGSTHQINVEGVELIDSFQPSSVQPFEIASTVVNVDDGQLTVDAIGGENTKINYIEFEPISSSANPEVTNTTVVTNSSGRAFLDTPISADIAVVVAGEGVDPTTLNTDNVRLYRTDDDTPVPGLVNTSGGNDVIVFQPSENLEPNTNYTFRVTSDVTDDAGNAFNPYSTSFTTGTSTNIPFTSGVEFEERTVYEGDPVSTLFIGPQGKLYGAGLDGTVRRWNINNDGSLSNEQVFSDDQLEGRAIVGVAFNPDDPLGIYLWTTNNDPLPVPGANGTTPDDFTGKVSRIVIDPSASNFVGEVEDYIVGLPRSTRDHLTNSLVFGPDEDPGSGVKRFLYLSQGSNTAMGAPDAAWGFRPERLLSAAVLKVDPDLMPPEGGIDVQTEDYFDEDGNLISTGDYDPFAPDAPVTIFAEGVRNAYDLVWHSNGNLYVPTNGSAAGGNTPDDPNTPQDEALQNVGTQNDYLFKINEDGGGYYGHPNPELDNYILNGGNPTAGIDPAEVVSGDGFTGYPVGIEPEPDYQGFAYDFGVNRSPNGVIEYESSTPEFGDALQNDLLVVEYSGGKNVLVLEPDAQGNITPGSATKIASGLDNPLDLIEDRVRNPGNLYVAELLAGGSGFSGEITLLEPV